MLRKAIVLFLMLGTSMALIATPTHRAGATTVPQCNGEDATIFGRTGNIVGTRGDDVIVGSSSADNIRGLDGDDIICGGQGNDTISGGNGLDELFGEQGSDTVSGGNNEDLIFGDGGVADLANYDGPEDLPLDVDCGALGGGNDILKGGAGNDAIFDPCGSNKAYGESGTDLTGVTGYADGGSGDDSEADDIHPIWEFLESTSFFPDFVIAAAETCPGCGDGVAKGGSGKDWVVILGGIADGGSGNDQASGVAEGDDVRGGSGSDLVDNFSGFGGAPTTTMTLNGGSGNDTCLPNTGDTLISCEFVP